MCLDIEIAISVPEETQRIARAAFPKGAPFMIMRDELGTLFQDEQFADLFPSDGQPGEAPWRLALVTVMQFAEGLSDRQAADAVRGRIDWKYALGLDLTDPGFDYSILCEFRERLLKGNAETRLFDTLLQVGRERKWIKTRGKQRTDATHVLASVRALNRLECVGETMRLVLSTLVECAPEWLQAHLPAEWRDRYGRRFPSVRLPQEKTDRETLAVTIGKDGVHLLELLQDPDTPEGLAMLPEVVRLRRVWIQQFFFHEGELRWRDSKEMPPAALSINSPHDDEARYSIKRETTWSGYKVHYTETCDEESPHLIVHVETTPGTTQDNTVTGPSTPT